MESLSKMTAHSLPLFDMNSEYLDKIDWRDTTNSQLQRRDLTLHRTQTIVGPRDSWPATLATLVNTCILPIPHAAAILWGDELAVIHNMAWGKATASMNTQGQAAKDRYSEEAMVSLHSSLRGRTAKVACRFLLPDIDHTTDATVLLSAVLDYAGTRQGVLAQLMYNLPLSGLDSLANEKEGRRTKDKASQQQKKSKDTRAQADSRQTHLFQRFAELLPNGLAILDSDAEAVFVNDDFFKLTTRKTSKDFRAWPESIDPRDYDKVMTAYRKSFALRRDLRVEFRCAGETDAETGEWRLFLLRPLSEDPEAGFICAVVDITEMKQAQLTQEKAAIEAQDRKEQQEKFIDMVSHEIRNPLSAVLHLAEEVKDMVRGLAANDEQERDQLMGIMDIADTILLCVSHQNTLVDDILSFSKLDSMMLSLAPTEVRPKWEFSTSLKVFNSEFKAKNIQFHYAMDVSFDEQGVDYVVADLNRMKQVLVNLITNAIKFTAKKQGERNITVSMGASTVRPTSYPPGVIFFGEEEAGLHIDTTTTSEWGRGSVLYLMVAVKDTGIGINKQDQEKLFERFRQATPKTHEKYGGSGLGLFIARKLCQLHGGDIGVSSKHGVGSTFGFFFKVRRSDDSSIGKRPSFGSRSGSDRSVSPRPRTRPSYNRTPSTLANIEEQPNEKTRQRIEQLPKKQQYETQSKEQSEEQSTRQVEERPKIETLTSHHSTNSDDVNESLIKPPTEERPEVNPACKTDERLKETQPIAEKIKDKRAGVNFSISKELPNIESGETARQEHAAKTVSDSQSRHKPGTHETILLVEDNVINQKVLRRQLQSRGFEVFVANNGQEAVDAVEERGKTDQDLPGSKRRNYFDCILMDQEMPLMDGNMATEKIRKLQAQGKAGRSPILGISANVREAQTDAMLEAGMDDVVHKPFKMDDLVKSMRRLMP